MRVRVDSALTFLAQDVSSLTLERLKKALSYPNPAFINRQRRGIPTDGIPELLSFLTKDAHGGVRIPRGGVHVLREVLGKEGVRPTFVDARVLPEQRLVLERQLPLRDYQQQAVDTLAKTTQGVAILPCGAGKTFLGIGSIRRLLTPTLVLVHTLDLAQQWLDELHSKLGVEAGLVGGGECRHAPVTVAVLQALARWEQTRLDAFLGGFGLLVTDECHHLGSSMFYNIIDRCPARYRLGLTATPEREDGLSPLINMFLGQTIIEVPHSLLLARGVLTLPEVRNIETQFRYEYYSPRDYVPMLSAVAADEERNKQILDAVVKEAREGHTCLVLSGRVDHCEKIAEAIREQGISAQALTSSVERKRRKDLLDAARDGRLSVLVATSLADEGLDLPRLSRVFLAFPAKAKGRTIQRIGRAMRPHPSKKDAVLFDFVDGSVPILKRHHDERRRLFARVLGITATQAPAACRAHGAREAGRTVRV